jgi:hypothetical protein
MYQSSTPNTPEYIHETNGIIKSFDMLTNKLSEVWQKSLEGPQWAHFFTRGCTNMRVHLKDMLPPASFKNSPKFRLESYTYILNCEPSGMMLILTWGRSKKRRRPCHSNSINSATCCLPTLSGSRLRSFSSCWNENWQGKPKWPHKTRPSATLLTTNGIEPSTRNGKPAPNPLSYAKATRGTLLYF